MLTDDRFITIQNAIVLTGRSDSTIRNWIRAGKIEATYLKGLRQWRINKESLLTFAEQGEGNEQPNSPND